MNPSITRPIWEQIDALEADPSSDGGARHCVTIEGDCAEPWTGFWVQFHAGQINFQHLDDTRRDEILGEILDPIDTPDEMQLVPGECVTFDMTGLDRSAVDGLLIRLLTEYFEVLEESPLAISAEEF